MDVKINYDYTFIQNNNIDLKMITNYSKRRDINFQQIVTKLLVRCIAYTYTQGRNLWWNIRHGPPKTFQDFS